MAHLAKFKGSQVYGLLNIHICRSPEDGHAHSNENIDPEKTGQNYDLLEEERGGLSAYEYYKQALEDPALTCSNRSDVVKLVDLCVQLPEDKENRGEEYERQFFSGVLDYGREHFKLVSAVVHKDEGRTHIHMNGIPIVKDKNDPARSRVCFSECFKRSDYSRLHKELEKHCRERTKDKELKLYDPEKGQEGRQTENQKRYAAEKAKEEAEKATREKEEAERKLQEKSREVEKQEKELKQREKDTERKEKELNKREAKAESYSRYFETVEKYKEICDLTDKEYFMEIYKADRGLNSYPLPEALNPDRSREQQQSILKEFEREQEKEKERDAERTR